MRSWVILPILLMAIAPFRAGAAENDVVGARPGYVFDVQKEKYQHDEELVLIEEPKPLVPLRERLFDEQVSKDIRTQYEQRFGHSAMEQTMNAPQSRETSYYYNGDTTVTAEQYQKYQRSFGEYVGRKVMETQADKFFKSDPSMASVYKYKDTFSNASVATKSGYKFNWHHNISGNTSEFLFENPYHVETKVIVEFDGFSQRTSEETLNLGYTINTLYRLDSYYKFYDGVFQVVGTRRITSSVSASLTGSQTTTANGPSVRQSMLVMGISWTQ